MRDLSQVSIGIKTFLRDEKLFRAIAGIREIMPEVTIIVADCGRTGPIEKENFYDRLANEGHGISRLLFDAGFGSMSNVVAASFRTKYLLIGSDDFDFKPPSVRLGIENMFTILELTDVDIASGRVRGPYEFDLEDSGDTIIEHPVRAEQPTPWFVRCDLTVNYSLMKRRVFEKVKWDDDVKIGGGEHGAFFVDVKRAGLKVAYIPGASIQEQSGEDSEEYKTYRRRAASPDRPCFARRGIDKYVLGSGKIDWEASKYKEPITR